MRRAFPLHKGDGNCRPGETGPAMLAFASRQVVSCRSWTRLSTGLAGCKSDARSRGRGWRGTIRFFQKSRSAAHSGRAIRCPTFPGDGRSRIHDRCGQDYRGKRHPAAMTVTAAFAPAWDAVVAATTAVTVSWIAAEACVRIGPAVAVDPGVPPVGARRSRRAGRNGKTGAGNGDYRAFSVVPHDQDPV